MSNFDFAQKKWLLLFALAIGAIYAPSINGPFILDDSHTISGNAAIQNPANIFQVWKSGRYYSSSPDNWGYRPLTATANLICWWIGGGATWPFHVLKLLAFVSLCVVLYRVWRKLLPEAPESITALAIVLFGMNPVNSQVVCYISATSTLLAGLLFSVGLLGYLNWRETHDKKFLIGAFLSLFLSMLAKEEGVVLLAVVPAVELFLRVRSGKMSWKTLPWLAWLGFAVAAGGALALIVLMFEPTSNIARGDLSRMNYFMTQWRAYLRYLYMFWFPIHLNADNLEFGFSLSIRDPRVIFALATNLVLLGLALFYVRKQPIWALGLFWFYAAISPSSSLVVLAEPVNDHRAFIGYFGLIGFNVVLLKFLCTKFPERKRQLLPIILAVLAVSTYHRAWAWSSNEWLWTDTVTKNPSSPRALNNLAVQYMDTNRMAEALVLLDKCRIVGSQYGMCYLNRATTLAALGRDQEAEADYALAVQWDRTQVASRRHWARFLRARGFYTKALALLQEADNFASGQNISVRIELIQTKAQIGDIPAARALWNESLLLYGQHSSLVNIGKAWGFNASEKSE